MTAASPKRRWLRFSLRTLLLLVLLIGNGATLWWNWWPWKLAYTITKPGWIVQRATFSDDDQFIITDFFKDGADYPKQHLVEIYHADTGRLHFTISEDQKSSNLPLSPQHRGDWIFMAENRSKLFRLTTGERFNLAVIANTHLSRNYVMVAGVHLLALPTFEKIIELKDRHGGFFSPSESVVALPVQQQYHFFSLETRAKLGTFTSPDMKTSGSRNYQFWGDDRFLCETHDYYKVKTAYLYDIKLDKTVLVYEGEFFGPYAGKLFVQDRQGHAFELDKNLGMHPLNRSLSGAKVSSRDNPLVFFNERSEMLDLESNEILWSAPPWKAQALQRNLLWVASDDKTKHRILDARSGSVLFNFDSRTRIGKVPESMKLAFAHNTDAFVMYADPKSNNPCREAFVFRLSRPWQWYGSLYLPEFWLTLILAIAFLWSLWRDRRIGKPA